MSKLGQLVLNDYVKGAIMFVGAAVLTVLIQMLQAGGFAGVDINNILQVASIAMLTYMLKNFGTEKTPTTETVVGIKLDTK